MTGFIGQKLGNYQLQKLLGSGGFADVYLGEHMYLGNHAAVKVLQTKLADDEHDDFIQEARILARLSHPHIVRVLEFGIEQNQAYLVMNYASKGTLRKRHPRGSQLPLATVVAYVKQIANALQYAHDQRCVHRDLKPDNILVDQNNGLLVSDFGLARIYRTNASEELMSKHISGTAPYMAPEQFQGKTQFASDQYSLGVMIYEWLCGTLPFKGNFLEILAQHMSVESISLQAVNPAIPDQVEQVVQKALAKNPADRFANIWELARAFEQAYYRTPSPMINFATAGEPELPTIISVSKEEEVQAVPWSSTAMEAAAAPLSSDEESDGDMSMTEPRPAVVAPTAPVAADFSRSDTISVPDYIASLPAAPTPLPPVPAKSRFSLRRRPVFVALVVFLVIICGISFTLGFLPPSNGTTVRIDQNPTAQPTQSSSTVTSGSNTHPVLTPTVLVITHTKTPVTPVMPVSTVIIVPTNKPVSTVKSVSTAKPVLTPTPKPTPKPTPACPSTIEYGSTGSLVKTLQQSLNAHYSAHDFSNSPYNFSPLLDVDGDFGSLTQSAVKDYQSANSLQVDGIVGPETWHSLGYC